MSSSQQLGITGSLLLLVGLSLPALYDPVDQQCKTLFEVGEHGEGPLEAMSILGLSIVALFLSFRHCCTALGATAFLVLVALVSALLLEANSLCDQLATADMEVYIFEPVRFACFGFPPFHRYFRLSYCLGWYLMQAGVATLLVAAAWDDVLSCMTRPSRYPICQLEFAPSLDTTESDGDGSSTRAGWSPLSSNPFV